MQDYIRFVIITTGRTGSTWLVEALNSHDNVVCFGSPFEVGSEYVSFDVDGYDNFDANARTLRDTDGVAFLNTYIFGEHEPDTRAVGFKFQYRNWVGFGEVLGALVEDRDLKVIHLRRANLLRSLVSLRLAKATGQYHKRPMRLNTERFRTAARHPMRAFERLWRRMAARRRYEPPGLALTQDECREHFMSTKLQERSFEDQFTGHDLLDVTYEEMVEDFKSATERIEDFLGVPRAALTYSQEPVNPQPLRELVSNYDELAAAFRGTPPEAYFE